MKKGLTLFVLFAVVLILTGCDMVQSDTEAISDSGGIDVSELFTKRDM